MHILKWLFLVLSLASSAGTDILQSVASSPQGVQLTLTFHNQSSETSAWLTYASPDYGLVIQYPENMTFYSGRLEYKDVTLLSMTPVCSWRTIACFAYNGTEYAGTDFQAAGLSVNVLRDRRSESECNRIDSPYPTRRTAINGIPFRYGVWGGAAAGSIIDATEYRTFYENVCFAVTLSVATSDGHDPSVKPFDRGALDREMSRMVRTFRFVGPVADGAHWLVYRSKLIGYSLEYPEGDPVWKTSEYSYQKFDSNEISDSVHFADRGLTYTVATKVNLRDENQVRRWLKSSGYPDLSEAEVLKRARYYSEYRAGPFYYIFGQGSLYILSVADEQQHMIEPRNAPAFRHLLNSFTP